MSHLKSEIYYSDLYDSITVEHCRSLEDSILCTDMTKYEVKGATKAHKKQAQYMVHQLLLYYEAGERCLQKTETIREWMERDRLKDERLENTQAPTGVNCLKCHSVMTVSSKHLNQRDDTDFVLFFYDCPKNCLPRRAFYDDNKEFISKPHLCEKCQTELSSTDNRKGSLITTKYKCSNCGNVKVDILNLNAKEESKPDENYEEDRRRFCFSEEKGKKYLADKESTIRFYNLAKEIDERQKNKDQYDAVEKIKKLSFAEVQKLLIPMFEQLQYTNLQFQPPEINKDVTISFTAVDSKENRSERDSKQDLKKTVDEVLKESNWRLMSAGIDYRLGFVSGRLRGFEKEEDLLKLVNNINKSHELRN